MKSIINLVGNPTAPLTWFQCFASVIVIFALSNPAHAQDWERLSDGRIVIEIKGNRLAFDPNAAQGPNVRFEPSGGGEAIPETDGLNFSQVVARPDHARSVFKKWRVVVVRASNGRHLPGRYLNRYDRNKIPGGRIELAIYEDPQRMLCRAQPNAPGTSADCPRFNEFARNPPALDEDGLIVVAPLPSPAMQRVTYIFPKAEFVSATNEAIYFQCDPLSTACRNTFNNFVGYAIRANVSLFYQFSSNQYPKHQLRDLHRTMIEIFNDILISNREGR
jgi:hypothetical protein